MSGTMKKHALPIGKLPPEMLAEITRLAPVTDPRIQLGPGIGLDCGIIELEDRFLVMKTDPITFATDKIGWYAVNVNANDIATTGARPKWIMVTTLFPENKTDQKSVFKISEQLFDACRQMDISLVNAHTEITFGISRPIMICAMVGEVEKDKLVTPTGCRPGDAILVTKGVPIEGTAILAAEFSERLKGFLSEEELRIAQNFTHNPGIGVTRDAQLALAHGQVTAMHDPTEGGIASALWELSHASGRHFTVNPDLIPIPALSAKICGFFGLNPLNTIASGALLMTVAQADKDKILEAFKAENIPCKQIGTVSEHQGAGVTINDQGALLPWPERDEIGKVF